MKILFFALLGCCVLTQPVLADSHTNISDKIINSWGGKPGWITCGENDTQGCIGKTLRENNCKTIQAKVKGEKYNVYTFMLARKVNEHGAFFCPTTFGTDINSYTLFYEPEGNRTCIWLCRQGWTGDSCNTKVEEFSGTCDVQPFLRVNYDDVKPDKYGSNIEWELEYVNHSKTVDCKTTNGKIDGNVEHDILIAVNKFLNSGNGAFARMMEFSARSEISPISTIEETDMQIYPAMNTQDILLCKIGYKPNASNTDCEPINPADCTKSVISTKMCPEWDLSAYDETVHITEIHDNCFKYKCKDAGYAFASATDRKCVECSSNMKNGVSPTDGTCVKCKTGKIFDASSGDCKDALALTHQDMQYGQNKDKESYEDKKSVKEQCWAKTSLSEYRDCVLRSKDD